MESQKSWKRDLIPVIILIVMIIIRFAPFIFTGKAINTDSWKNIEPWKNFPHTTIGDMNLEYGVWFPMVKDELAHGRFPHWNPYSFCGTPLYANHLVPVFHIPFALSLLFPDDLIGSAYAMIMALIGTLFFYFFLRNWNFDPYTAFFGGMVFFLSGWIMYLQPPDVAAFIWIPAILLFYDRFLERDNIRDACIGAFCFGQFLIAGYPVNVVHFLYFLVVYFIWRYFQLDSGFRINLKHWISGVLIIFVFGGLLSAVQNYPTYKFMKISNRDITSERERLDLSGNAQNVNGKSSTDRLDTVKLKITAIKYILNKIVIIAPFMDRELLQSRAFVGPIVIFLTLVALISGQKRFNVFKLIFSFVALMCFIRPLYVFFAKYLPGWSITNLLPLEIFYFSMFFLAAAGFSTLISMVKQSRTLAILCITVIIIILSLFLIPQKAVLYLLDDTTHWSSGIDHVVRHLYFCMSLIMMIIILFHLRKPNKLLVRSSLLIFMITGLMIHYYLFPMFDTRTPVPLNEEMRKITEICKDGRIIRYKEIPDATKWNEPDYLLTANIPIKFKIYDTFGYDSQMLGDYSCFIETLTPGTIVRRRFMHHVTNPECFQPEGFLARSTGIKYILSKDDLSYLESTQLVYDGSFKIFELKERDNPFAYFANNFEITSDSFRKMRENPPAEILLIPPPPAVAGWNNHSICE
jgi:hypothetical protein